MRDHEHRPPALDARLDESLRARFAPPVDLEERVARWRTHARPLRARSLGARSLWDGRVKRLVLAAAAAAVVLVGLWLRARGGEPAPSVVARLEVLERLGPRAPAARDFPPVGPLHEPTPEVELHSADLTHLYTVMDAAQRGAASVACGEDDQLAERLHKTYGQEVELEPGASGFLHGPFASAEWPTGTILTGSADDMTSVLIADHDDTLACCLRMSLDEDSGLNLFTWRVGEIVLTELTPRGQPLLISCFKTEP